MSTDERKDTQENKDSTPELKGKTAEQTTKEAIPSETDKPELDESKSKVKKDEKSKNKKKEDNVILEKKKYEELVSIEKIAMEEVKRARADSLNFRRRVEKEKDEFLKYSSAKILEKFLPIVDDLHRLVEQGKDTIDETHMQPIKSVLARIEKIFDEEGVKLIEIKKGKTKFDPRFHEAIFALPSEEHDPNIVVDIVNTGFVKGERVLRPAKVVISKKNEVSETNENKEEN